jgi:hypothetical protein
MTADQFRKAIDDQTIDDLILECLTAELDGLRLAPTLSVERDDPDDGIEYEDDDEKVGE